MDPGTCDYNITRFYYNYKKHICESFIYKGCKGNFNNFFKEEECIEECIPK